ncbi:MAG: ABC transporter permease [Solimonas sp.]
MARRSLHTLLTLAAVLTVMWGLFRLIPGDPVAVLLGTGQLGPEDVAKLRQAWALDQPLYQQYLNYLGNFITGDLGISFQFRRPVLEVVLPTMMNTLILMGPAIVIASAIGVAVGAWLAWRRGTAADSIGGLLVLLPRSLPIFWIGILFLMVFAYWLNLLPIGGMRTPGFYPESFVESLPGYDLAIHLVMPLAVAILYFVADPLMIMRTSTLEASTEDYILYARAAGLRERDVRGIARRNALLPVVTYSAIMVSFAFGGQVLLEVVFSWPGMGRLMVQAVSHRDYPVAQAAFFFMAAIVILFNLAVDMLYAFLDPRISYEA